MRSVKEAMLLYAVTDRSWLNGRSLYEDVEKALGVKVIKTPNTGAGFVKAILS